MNQSTNIISTIVATGAAGVALALDSSVTAVGATLTSALTAQVAAQTSLASLDGKQPALAAHGGIPVEGVTGGVAIPVTLSAGALTIGKVDQGAGGVSAWKVDGSAVTQPVSDGGGSLTVDGTVALAAGVAVIGHVVTDTGSTTAVTALPAIPTGTNTIGAVTGPSAAPLALDASVLALSAKLPATLGVKAGASSLSVALSTEDAAKVPALGQALAAASVPSVLPVAQVALLAQESGGHLATIDTSTAAVATTVSGGRVLTTEASAAAILAKFSAGQAARAASLGVTLSTEDAAKVPALGQALAASSTPVVLTAIQIAQLAQTGQLPAALGRTAAASSLSTVLSTEDAAKVPALGQALAAASVPHVLPVAQDVVAYAGSGGKILVTETSGAAAKVDLDTIAGGYSAHNATLPANVGQIAGIGQDTAPAAVTAGNSVRAWFLRVGAQVGAMLGADGATIASAANAVPVSPGTSTLWDVSSRVARLIGAVTGKDGSTISSATNGVAVAPETSSVWDVSSRAARLLGALTGINGSGVATGANPVPVQLSDGAAVFTGTKTGQLPSALGLGSATSALLTARCIPSVDQQTTLATAGKVIKGTPGMAYGLSYFNNTGSSVFILVFNTTSLPSAGDRPAYFSGTITTTTKSFQALGVTALGQACPVGITFAISTTQDTFTATASTAFPYALAYD